MLIERWSWYYSALDEYIIYTLAVNNKAPANIIEIRSPEQFVYKVIIIEPFLFVWLQSVNYLATKSFPENGFYME